VIGPAGNRIRYEYDRHGDLIAVTDRTGPSALNPQPPAHHLASITDALGRSAAAIDYDADGRVLQLRDAADNATDYGYNRDQRSQTVTDPGVAMP
jgi:YD repeat-containing protein